jgi:uncharacterized protein
MTPQERQRVERLFERLSQLENSPREREAERLIAERLRAVPNAPYALIQTVLVQEEALARANERIRQLEGGDNELPESEGGSFLDTLRGALAGQAATPPRRSSVPLTRGRDAPMGVPQALERELQSGNAPDAQIGRGGSFLGQAAAIATGVVVGSMAVDMLRGQSGSQSAATNSQQADAQDAHAQQASHLDAGEDDGEDGDYDTADFDDGDGFDIDFG